MQAINDYVVIKPIKEEPKQVSGFILTETTTDDIRYLKAEVISCGNLTQGIEPSNTIYYDKHAGHDILFENKQYKVIRQRDIVLVQ